MRSFLKAIGEVISAILYAIRKAQERKRQANGRTEREDIKRSPAAWFNRKYGMRSSKAKANPPGDGVD